MQLGGFGIAPLRRYLSRGWNVIDAGALVLMHYLCVAWLATGIINAETAAIAGLLAFAKLLSYLRAFKPLASLVAVLSEVVKDSAPFLLILLVALLGFTTAFNALGMFGSASMALYSTFMLGLGELFLEVRLQPTAAAAWRPCLTAHSHTDTPLCFSRSPQDDTFTDPSPQKDAFKKALQIGCLLFVLVVMMNLLIAVISDSFERVQEHAAAQFQLERANIIRDNNAILDALQWCFGDRWAEPPCRWLHVLRPREGAGAGGAEAAEDDEWGGRMRGLKRHQEQLGQRTDAKIAELGQNTNAKIDTKIAELGQRTDAKIAELGQRTDAKMAELDAKLDLLLGMVGRQNTAQQQ